VRILLAEQERSLRKQASEKLWSSSQIARAESVRRERDELRLRRSRDIEERVQRQRAKVREASERRQRTRCSFLADFVARSSTSLKIGSVTSSK